jgi:hypothetical protein
MKAALEHIKNKIPCPAQPPPTGESPIDTRAVLSVELKLAHMRTKRGHLPGLDYLDARKKESRHNLLLFLLCISDVLIMGK